MKPFKQGQLDPFCGVYSMINALTHITGMDKYEAQILYKQTIRFISKKYGKDGKWLNGITGKHMDEVYKSVFKGKFGVDMVKPFNDKQGDIDISGFWSFLITFFYRNDHDPRAVVIAFEEGDNRHWTTIVGVTDKRLKLFDSCGLKSLKKKHITLMEGESDKGRPVRVDLKQTCFFSQAREG